MKEPASDKAKLQGKWKVQSLLMGGKDMLGPLGQQFDMTFEFNGETVVARVNGGTVQKSASAVKYGSRAARQIKITDTHRRWRRQAGEASNGQDGGEVGYAFEGEKLLLGSAGNGKGAVDPLNPGPTDIVIVLVRVK